MLVTKSVEIVRSLASPGTKRMFSVGRSGLGRRAKVVVVGSGRMGQIRSSLIYANPRFELCGIVDVNMEGASAMADMFGVRNKQCPCQC
jgi:predicted homoserine dehydrogenase-like protein